jgi:hypothetical protein
MASEQALPLQHFLYSSCCGYAAIIRLLGYVLFLNYKQLEIQRKTENKMKETNSPSKRGTS